jgi:voltage-gated potassium channel
MRFLRILKISRYNNSLNLIWSVIKEKKAELLITGFVTFLILLIASFIMYFVEGNTQPEAFPDIPSSIWWAVATLTTVGYGDIYPITGAGKFISGVIAILGIGLVALPTGLISAGFMEKIKNKKQENTKCPHCGNEKE